MNSTTFDEVVLLLAFCVVGKVLLLKEIIHEVYRTARKFERIV